VFDVLLSQNKLLYVFHNFCIIVSYVFLTIFLEDRIFFIRFSHVSLIRNSFVGASYELLKIKPQAPCRTVTGRPKSIQFQRVKYRILNAQQYGTYQTVLHIN